MISSLLSRSPIGEKRLPQMNIINIFKINIIHHHFCSVLYCHFILYCYNQIYEIDFFNIWMGKINMREELYSFGQDPWDEKGLTFVLTGI